MGLEPTTFCMASRRSSQLSYIRVDMNSSRCRAGSPAAVAGGLTRFEHRLETAEANS